MGYGTLTGDDLTKYIQNDCWLSVLTYRADKLTSSKWGKFWVLSSIWPWRSWSITPQNNRDLNQGILHIWSKFGDPSLNGYRADKLKIDGHMNVHTDRQTHTHTQATTIPEGQNWPRVKTIKKLFSIISNVQTHYYFKLDIQKVDQHTGGKWSIHDPKRCKNNQLQSL